MLRPIAAVPSCRECTQMVWWADDFRKHVERERGDMYDTQATADVRMPYTSTAAGYLLPPPPHYFFLVSNSERNNLGRQKMLSVVSRIRTLMLHRNTHSLENTQEGGGYAAGAPCRIWDDRTRESYDFVPLFTHHRHSSFVYFLLFRGQTAHSKGCQEKKKSCLPEIR